MVVPVYAGNRPTLPHEAVGWMRNGDQADDGRMRRVLPLHSG